MKGGFYLIIDQHLKHCMYMFILILKMLYKWFIPIEICSLYLIIP